MSLRKRITLTICSIIVLLMLLLSSVIYSKSALILNEEAEKYMVSQLERAKENIDLLLEINGLETERLSLNRKVIDFIENKRDPSLMNEYLIKEMALMNETKNYFKDLFIMNTDGTIIATCMPEAVLLDLSTREYFIESKRTHKIVTSDTLIARSDGSLIVNTVCPIYSLDKKVIGFAGIAMKAEYFSNIVEELNLGKDGYYSIVDSNNRVLVHKDKGLISKESPYSITEAMLSGMEDKDSIIKRVETYDEIKQMHIYRFVDSKRWVLIAILPVKQVFARSSSLLFYVILVGSFGIVLAILIGVYISERISEPVVTVTRFINRAVKSNSIIENSISNSIKELSMDEGAIFDEYHSLDGDEIGNLRKAFINLKDYFTWLTNRYEYENNILIEYTENLSLAIEDSYFRTANFISTLSHDLKTSITLIKGYSKGLLTGVIEDEYTKKNFLEGIYTSTMDIEKITCDILDNAYEAQCCMKLNKERVNCKEFIGSLYDKTRRYIKNSNRVFEGNLVCDNDIFILVDKTKIKRAWFNLVNNSVKYSRDGSLIIVEVLVTDGYIELRIEDRGCGIHDDDQEKIFDMLYKGRDNMEKGYGLGLFIAKSIIEAHGSELRFYSKVDKGTIFWFRLDTSS